MIEPFFVTDVNNFVLLFKFILQFYYLREKELESTESEYISCAPAVVLFLKVQGGILLPTYWTSLGLKML